MHIGFGVKTTVFEEGQKVHRGQVTRRVIEEHIFGTGVRAADLTVFRAGVPGVDRVVELNARIGTGPCGVTDVLPQIASVDGLGDLAIGAAQQLPFGVVFDGLEERIGDAHGVVGVLARHRGVGLGVPIGVIGREFDRGITLFRVIQHPLDVGFRDADLFGGFDRRFQGCVYGRIERVVLFAIPCANGVKNLVQLTFVHLGACDDGRHFLLFDHLPVDEFFDIRVIHVTDHHFRGTARGAARFDRTGGPVTDFEEPHQAGGFATARQRFVGGAQGREIGARAGAVFEQPRLADPKVHDAAIRHQIVFHRLDETGMGLRVLIGGTRTGQLPGFVIDIIVPLPRTVDAVSPMQTGVEPLRAVRRAHLRRQGKAHVIVIGAGVVLRGEITTLPAPIGPSPRQTVEHLFCRGLAAKARVLRQFRQRLFVGNGAPQKRRNALFTDFFQRGRDTGLAEIFLSDDIGCHLRPPRRDFTIIKFKHHGAVRIANLGGGGGEFQLRICVLAYFGEFTFDFHLMPASFYQAST